MEDIKETHLECSNCGYVDIWEPTIWSYVPHEPKPLVCPKCGEIEWDNRDDNEQEDSTN